MHRLNLPTRLSLLMTAIILLFLATVSGAVWHMSTAMNQRAAVDSKSLIESGISGFTDGLDTLVTDYNNWDAAYVAIKDQDAEWLYDNYVSSIDAGNAMQIIALFGGPIGTTQSWIDNGEVEPVPNIVPRNVLDSMQRQISEFDLGSFQAARFAAQIDGVPYVFSGARIEPYDYEKFPEATIDNLAFAVFGNRVSEDFLTAMGDQFLLENLTFSVELPLSGPSTALLGSDGNPMGYLGWTAPTPGTALLSSIVPSLGAIAFLFVLVAGTVTLLIRAIAAKLVDREISSANVARTDNMTGLPNRLAFIEHFESCPNVSKDTLGIVFIDINGFKRVNDTIGHEGGDELVRELATRLGNLCSEEFFLARIGGDEFVFVCSGKETAERLKSLTEDIRHVTTSEFVLSGQNFVISLSQGVAVNDSPKLTIDEILRRADLAMYHAKRSSDPNAVFYNSSIESQSRESKIVEDALRLALEKGDEFEIHYQPIVDARTGELVKAEALARWTSPVIGSVPPDRFIEIAEENGLIIELGQKLLSIICVDLKSDPDLRVSINISPLQLKMPSFVKDLVDTFAAYGISHDRVELELTETVAVDNTELASFKLAQLRDLGFSTSLDDFGTGFSSIGYLRQLPFDTLKIDRSFVDCITANDSNRQMVGSIIALGHSLEKVVVVEGVETAEQAQVLEELKCDLFQGYYFGKPMPLSDLRTAYPLGDENGNELASQVA